MIDKYKIAFAQIKGMGIDFAQKLLSVIDSEEQFFKLSENDLIHLVGCKNKIFHNSYRETLLNNASNELEFIDKCNINTYYFKDSKFPKRLFDASDAPILLFGKGDCELNHSKIISIVGTRNATNYGKSITESIVKDLSGIFPDTIIVSGLAYGIDITAHKKALEYKLPPIAVLAHGLNMIYPAAHRKNAIEIINNNGLILSEYLSGTTLHKSNFLARNRIVASLSDCTVIIESAEKGGAIVTANIAASYNRDVFAVPGRANDIYSKGCNNLISRNKASLIENASQIIESMNWEKPKNINIQKEIFPNYTCEESLVVNFLTKEGENHINKIANSLNMPISRLMSLLVDMEFNGYIKSLPGGKYSI